LKRKGLVNRSNILWILITLVFLFYIVLRFVWGDLLIFHKSYDPFGDTLNYIEDKINKPMEYANSVVDLTEENIELKTRLKEYDLLVQNYEEIIEENKRLKKLLGTKQVSGFTKKLGIIIGNSPDIWHQEIIIDIGTNDGIKINDAVISSWGLVGKVKSVNESNSVVQLVIDSSNWVSCRNNRSRDIGMLKVEDNKTGKLSYLVNKSDFKVNDLIVTSGLGGIYPKDIPVGVITRVMKKSGDDIPEIDVSLLTDFSDLEEVIVLVKNES
jgi:rod shape-determining protein MreC